MDDKRKRWTAWSVIGAILAAGGGPLIVEVLSDGYHSLRDEMIDDNMQLIGDFEDRTDELQAAIDSLRAYHEEVTDAEGDEGP